MFVTGNIGFGFYCAIFTNIHATLLIHSCFLLNPGLVILFFGPYVVITLRRGVNRAMQTRWSVPFFSNIRRSAKIFLSNPKSQRHPKTEMLRSRFKGKLVHVNVTVNFVQIVKKATCLMTTKQYISNNSLTLEFKWTSFEKRNNLNELINIPIKAAERSVIQISFRTQGPKIRQAQSGICVKNYSWSTIHCVFQIRESARFSAQIHNPCAFLGQIRRSESLFTPL